MQLVWLRLLRHIYATCISYVRRRARYYKFKFNTHIVRVMFPSGDLSQSRHFRTRNHKPLVPICKYCWWRSRGSLTGVHGIVDRIIWRLKCRSRCRLMTSPSRCVLIDPPGVLAYSGRNDVTLVILRSPTRWYTWASRCIDVIYVSKRKVFCKHFMY